VSEQLLKGTQINAGHDQAGCERVAHVVPAEALDLGFGESRDEHPTNEVAGIKRRLPRGAGEDVGPLDGRDATGSTHSKYPRMSASTKGMIFLVSSLALLVVSSGAAHGWRGPAAAAPFHMVADPAGNLFADSSRRVHRHESPKLVMKLDQRGHVAWQHRIRGTNHRDQGGSAINGLVAIPDGDVVVAGATSDLDGARFAVARLDGRDGREHWLTRVHGSVSSYTSGDRARAAALCADGDIVADGTLTNRDGGDGSAAVVKLAGATGEERWRALLPSLTASDVMAVDVSGDVLAGGSFFGLEQGAVNLVKIAGGTGALVWQREVDAAWRTSALALDTAGDVLLAVSTSEPDGNDFGVVKIAGHSGEILWIARESGSTNRWQEALRVVVDSSGGVFAAGMTNNGAGDAARSDGYVFTVVRLDRATGTRRWIYRAPSPAGYGFATQLQLDPSGLVIAAGTTGDVTSCQNGFIVALDPVEGHVVWSSTFDGTASAPDCRYECPYHARCPFIDNDDLTALALDPTGRMFVGLVLLDGRGFGARFRATIRRLSVPTMTSAIVP